MLKTLCLKGEGFILVVSTVCFIGKKYKKPFDISRKTFGWKDFFSFCKRLIFWIDSRHYLGRTFIEERRARFSMSVSFAPKGINFRSIIALGLRHDKGRLQSTILRSDETVHVILLCYLGNSTIRCNVSPDLNMVARNPPLRQDISKLSGI